MSRDGSAVYAASALSNALAVLTRDPEGGSLSQAGEGAGCIAAALSGCAAGVQLEGANAVATSPGNDVVYVTSLLANSVTVFQPATTAAGMAQKGGTAGCVVWLRSVGCGFGRALKAPEGVAVSPDGHSVYAAAFRTGALDVFDRNRETGSVSQKPGDAGCLARRAVTGLRPRPGAGRGQLDRGQRRRPLRLHDFLPQQRGRRLPEAQMSEQDKQARGLTRKELIGSGAGAAAAALLAASGVERALGGGAGAGRQNLGGMNVILFITDQERAIQHFPPQLAAQVHAGAAAAAPPRARLRTRLHQRLHVLAGPLDPDERLLPRPARGQVHARGKHAGRRHARRRRRGTGKDLPAGRTADRPGEPGDGDARRRLQRRLQGQVALLEAGHARGSEALRPRKVRLPALGPARRRRQPDRAGGGRRLRRQRRPLHGLARAAPPKAARACCST